MQYVYLQSLLLVFADASGVNRVSGAHVRDTHTGEEWDIRAKCTVNATGPFTDFIRKMGGPNVEEICQPAAGVHLTLPDYYW